MIRLTILIFLITSLALSAKPKVMVFTDINIGGGDPDDRQSLIHLFWYANDLDIVSIVPYRWNKEGLEACQMAAAAYASDFDKFALKAKGYPDPESIDRLFAKNSDEAREKFLSASLESSESDPLYILVWGDMKLLSGLLNENVQHAKNIRLIRIGTGLKYGPKDEVPGESCDVPNWNGGGRNQIYENQKFAELWWLEINWTYNGMFSGIGPTEMFERLAQYGEMGKHIKYVTKGHDWAQYFRVGDTPSVLYLIDPKNILDDPTQSSWAGKFKKPFPIERPNYFTDDNGNIEWNYHDPCQTWENLEAMYAYNKSTLEAERPEMYRSLIERLEKIYK